MLLENEQYLAELTKLFREGRTHESGVTVTMKRYDGRSKPPSRNLDKQQKQDPHHEYKCLFRAVLGNKKISTVVAAKDVNKFQLAYANVFKASMDNLKKRDRKTEKERKEKRKETVGVSSATSATAQQQSAATNTNTNVASTQSTPKPGTKGGDN